MADETQGKTDRADASDKIPQTGSNAAAPGGAPANQPGAPLSSSDTPSGDIGADMQKILADVKLPERRDSPLASDSKKQIEIRNIDAALNTPTPPPAPEFAAPPPKDSIQTVHTLKQDLQQVVHDQKISVVRAAALEQDKSRGAERIATVPQRSNRVKNIVFGALLLLFLGGAALGGVYVVMQSNAEPLPEQPTNSLVFAEQTVSLPIDGQSPGQLKSLLAEARGASNASLGTITRIAPVKTSVTESGESMRLATLPEFFAAIDAHPPDELQRALSQEFFFGLHTVDKNAPLIVIPVLSYERAFAGMLEWESTLNRDLAPIYVRVPDLVPGESGIPQARVFRDDVMRNYDVRVLKNDSGEIVLYYAFPSRGLLVIAESPYTFTELLSRFQAQKSI